MKDIVLLECAVANYDWGSHTLIADLLGVPRSSRRQSELWMGAHEPYPSHVELEDERVSLIDLIARQPRTVLGQRVSERFDEELPYLFKVLAAERPLSIQAHPDAHAARAGFDRENSAGLPLDSGERTYVDAHHKPEILSALTPFSALRGFRSASQVRSTLERLGAGPLAAERVGVGVDVGVAAIHCSTIPPQVSTISRCELVGRPHTVVRPGSIQ